jgi:hypothetical protein
VIPPFSRGYRMRTRGDYESVLNADDDSRKMAYIKEGKRRIEMSG